MGNDNIKYDSTKRTNPEINTFGSGAIREKKSGKGRFDLITPIGLRRLAKHYENGAVVHGDRNWEKGMPISTYIDSAERHINDYKEGDRAEDHLAAIAWNVFAAIHTEEMIARGLMNKDMDNMPSFIREGDKDG